MDKEEAIALIKRETAGKNLSEDSLISVCYDVFRNDNVLKNVSEALAQTRQDLKYKTKDYDSLLEDWALERARMKTLFNILKEQQQLLEKLLFRSKKPEWDCDVALTRTLIQRLEQMEDGQSEK